MERFLPPLVNHCSILWRNENSIQKGPKRQQPLYRGGNSSICKWLLSWGGKKGRNGNGLVWRWVQMRGPGWASPCLMTRWPGQPLKVLTRALKASLFTAATTGPFLTRRSESAICRHRKIYSKNPLAGSANRPSRGGCWSVCSSFRQNSLPWWLNFGQGRNESLHFQFIRSD